MLSGLKAMDFQASPAQNGRDWRWLVLDLQDSRWEDSISHSRSLKGQHSPLTSRPRPNSLQCSCLSFWSCQHRPLWTVPSYPCSGLRSSTDFLIENLQVLVAYPVLGERIWSGSGCRISSLLYSGLADQLRLIANPHSFYFYFFHF